MKNDDKDELINRIEKKNENKKIKEYYLRKKILNSEEIIWNLHKCSKKNCSLYNHARNKGYICVEQICFIIMYYFY
jgi:hypothetical protein